MRALSLALWGGSCGYTAQGATYPGFWMGAATAQLAPATCFTAVTVQWAASSAAPIGSWRVPPLDFTSVQLTGLDDSAAKKASLPQVTNYLTVSCGRPTAA